MEVKVISDLHIDINENVKWNFDPNTFYIIAGDISGSVDRTIDFVKTNIKKGVFVAGNHLGYDGKPIDESYKKLRKEFGKGPVRFLNNNVYKVGKVVFIGFTLWTDFELFGNKDLGMLTAWQCLNDYRYCRLTTGRLTPQLTVEWHNESLRYLMKQLEKYKDYKVVIVSHHGPSYKCLDDKYKLDQLSSAFTSNLDRIMYDYSNIVLWTHGHVHNKANYRVNKTRVVCNPYGYYNENLMDWRDLGLLINV